jgi:hypothetical protein
MMMKRTMIAAIGAAMLLGQPALAQMGKPIEVATPDPAKLEVSRKVALRLVPDGIFMKVMSGTMDQFMGGMMDQMMEMPLKEIAEKFAKNPEDLKDMGPATLNQIMAIVDPAFKERTQLGMKAMMSEMGGIMSEMEPGMREGMAVAYANRFSATELSDMDRFFSSPSGAKFASENMTIMTDPAIMKQMQALMPKVMEAMPGIIKRVEKATSELPAAKSPDTLTKAEREELAKLLGVKPSDLK